MKHVRASASRSRYVTVSLCALCALLALLVSACGSTSPTGSGTPTATATKGSGTVQVAYAGSLVSLMEKQVFPAFQQSSGYTPQGEAKGSSALANEIKGHLHKPDIFISAAPAVNKQLMGSANGNYVSWYINFARTEMVVGYSSTSKFAADFQAAANGSKPWYQVLQEPGMRIGRTDPVLDPKGAATIEMMKLAEKYYNQPGLEQKVLGADENASQIFPEETLVARLGSGQLDAGFFYINEAKTANIPDITVPAQVNLGDPTLAATYATATFTNPKTGVVSKGAPIVYTITIPSTVQNQAGAEAFVKFLLGSQGQMLLANSGLLSTPFVASGDATKVPQSLQQFISKG